MTADDAALIARLFGRLAPLERERAAGPTDGVARRRATV